MRTLFYFAVFILQVFSNEISEEEFIRRINSAQNLWKAAPNQFTSLNHETKKMYLGSNPGKTQYINRTFHPNMLRRKLRIPSTFDARTKWTKCQGIGVIKDQGACASDYAIIAASIASDRLCIASKFKINVNLSAEDILSCDGWCSGCYGCDYEYPFVYLSRYGVVTGGDYGSNEGCKPFSISPCGLQCNYTLRKIIECSNECSNKNYNRHYSKDKYYGKNLYEFPPRNIKAIQEEILTNGPVASLMKVYEDFFSYKEGVYAYVSGKFLGYLTVKIIGWGIENEIKYWLVTNSWGKDFGQDGFFKIRRGENECYIEGRIIGFHVKV